MILLFPQRQVFHQVSYDGGHGEGKFCALGHRTSQMTDHTGPSYI